MNEKGWKIMQWSKSARSNANKKSIDAPMKFPEWKNTNGAKSKYIQIHSWNGNFRKQKHMQNPNDELKLENHAKP